MQKTAQRAERPKRPLEEERLPAAGHRKQGESRGILIQGGVQQWGAQFQEEVATGWVEAQLEERWVQSYVGW